MAKLRSDCKHHQLLRSQLYRLPALIVSAANFCVGPEGFVCVRCVGAALTIAAALRCWSSTWVLLGNSLQHIELLGNSLQNLGLRLS